MQVLEFNLNSISEFDQYFFKPKLWRGKMAKRTISSSAAAPKAATVDHTISVELTETSKGCWDRFTDWIVKTCCCCCSKKTQDSIDDFLDGPVADAVGAITALLVKKAGKLAKDQTKKAAKHLQKIADKEFDGVIEDAANAIISGATDVTLETIDRAASIVIKPKDIERGDVKEHKEADFKKKASLGMCEF